VVGTISIAAQAMETGRGAFLPVLVVVTLVGFVGTAMVARFIEGRGR
jgi:multisubunit Na+/H+ antiporter MnhF subunit